MMFARKLPLARPSILLVGFLLFTAVFWSLTETRHLTVTEIVIAGENIPPELDGARIAHFADVHYGPLLPGRLTDDAVDASNGFNPDLVVLTGDYFSVSTKYFKKSFEHLNRLQARSGRFATIGNRDCDESIRPLSRKGVTDIPFITGKTSESKVNGFPVHLAGTYELFGSGLGLNRRMAMARPEEFWIVLSHFVESGLAVSPAKIDLLFSGDSHGGQINLFGLWAPARKGGAPPRYLSGVIKNGGMTALVSRGIGAVVPLRFFCPPELQLVTLKHVSGEGYINVNQMDGRSLRRLEQKGRAVKPKE